MCFSLCTLGLIGFQVNLYFVSLVFGISECDEHRDCACVNAGETDADADLLHSAAETVRDNGLLDSEVYVDICPVFLLSFVLYKNIFLALQILFSSEI